MAGIERVVRPYRMPENTPARRILKPGTKDAENVVLEFGRDGGSGKTIEGSYTYDQTFYVDASDVEIF